MVYTGREDGSGIDENAWCFGMTSLIRDLVYI
jgi:hypothetical protein